MPDESCQGHNERITRIEEEIKNHRANHEEVWTALKEMSVAITELAKEAAHREADRETFRRIFKQLETDRDEFTRLWARHDELVEKLNQAEIRRIEDGKQAEIKRLEEERLETRGRNRELMKFGLSILAAIAGSMLLTHLGLKP